MRIAASRQLQCKWCSALQTVVAPMQPGSGSRSVFPPFKPISAKTVSWSSDGLQLSEGAVRRAALAGGVEAGGQLTDDDSGGESDSFQTDFSVVI